MIRKRYVLGFAAAVYLFFATSNLNAAKPQKGLPTDFKLASLDGSKSISRIEPKNRYVIIDFWASWCQICKENLAKLEPVQKSWTNRPSKATMLAVSVDDTRDEAKNFFLNDGPGSELHFARKNAWFDQKQRFSGALNIKGIPYLMVVNDKGEVVMTHNGALTDATIKKISSLVQSK